MIDETPDPAAPSAPNVVNIDEVAEISHLEGDHWGGMYKPLTPAMPPSHLGVNLTRVPPGRSVCPFHAHRRDDEVFYVLQGRGVFRYGDRLQEIRPGDCIACPAGTGIAHQIANPYDSDLVYLAIGPNDPNEVCTYPDNGKIFIRSLKQVGYLQTAEYLAGEPRIFGLIRERNAGSEPPPPYPTAWA